MNRSRKVFTMGLVAAVIIAITSWQPIYEHQSCTKESSLRVSHSEAVFINDQKTIRTLPQKKVFIKERPEINFNNDRTAEQK